MSGMMGRRSVYTKITPLPRDIPRQLALDMLHSHEEVIKINPLVTGVRPINAPRDAAADEFFAQWYEISEIITWGFGMKKKIAFKGVFHDLPNGLQTHTYAPMGVDLRNKWTVRGNQPGEPREPRELGVETPPEGLYLREDVEIVCNLALTGFVKKEMKAAAGIMVDRLTRKAEMLDEGKLHAMFENGLLKTVNPSIAQQEPMDDMLLRRHESGVRHNGVESPGTPASPQSSIFGTTSRYENYHDLTERRSGKSVHRASSYTPSYQQSSYQGPERQSLPGANSKLAPIPAGAIEMEGSYYHTQQHGQKLLSPSTANFSAELADTSVSAPKTPPMPSPGAERPQPLNPHRTSGVPSPQPSPGISHRQSSSVGSPQMSQPGPQASTGSVTRKPNPPYPQGSSPPRQTYIQPPPQTSPQPNVHPANRESAQYGIANPSRDEKIENRYSNTPYLRPTDVGNQGGLAQQVAGLGIQDPQPGQSGLSKCPVCGDFEGDEAAVSHHVSKHFS